MVKSQASSHSSGRFWTTRVLANPRSLRSCAGVHGAGGRGRCGTRVYRVGPAGQERLDGPWSEGTGTGNAREEGPRGTGDSAGQARRPQWPRSTAAYGRGSPGG